MKKLLFTAISALAVAGVAQAAESTQFGVLPVPSSAAETIVSVPWIASGTGSESVKVADLVLTSGLNLNDELRYYNGSKYECWILADDGSGKYWKASNNVTEGKVTAIAGAQDKTIPRGKAIILKRGADSSKGETIASKFYIMGKPFSGTEAAVTIPGGDAKSPVYSLVAPPAVADVDVNSGIEWTGIGDNDMLLLSDGSSLIWGGNDDKNWYKRVNNIWTKDNVQIAAGTGAWFISKTAGEKTFKLK